jgi:hypothetical protein
VLTASTRWWQGTRQTERKRKGGIGLTVDDFRIRVGDIEEREDDDVA